MTLQYEVTQHGATSPAFDNAYLDNHALGIYVDIVSGEPLFRSAAKFDSGTGWPSFSRPLEPDNVVQFPDALTVSASAEAHSRHASGHFGHVFADAPLPIELR
jgi:peptide methionine sulfoxide reductase msrA/msrB